MTIMGRRSHDLARRPKHSRAAVRGVAVADPTAISGTGGSSGSKADLSKMVCERVDTCEVAGRHADLDCALQLALRVVGEQHLGGFDPKTGTDHFEHTSIRFRYAEFGTIEDGVEARLDPECLHLLGDRVGAVREHCHRRPSRTKSIDLGKHRCIDCTDVIERFGGGIDVTDSCTDLLHPITATHPAGDHLIDEFGLKRHLVQDAASQAGALLDHSDAIKIEVSNYSVEIQ